MIRTALLPNPNVYDLQQIEVLRGPQGTLYGANALNGVVRVLTNNPDLHNFDFKTRGSTSSTENGGANYGGDAAVNIPIVDGVLAARLAVGDDHQSGWIDSRVGAIGLAPQGSNINNADLSNVRLKINAQPTDALSIELSTWHSQSSFGAPSLGDGSGEQDSLIPQPNYSQFNAYGFKVDYEFPLVSVSSMTSYVAYSSSNTFDYAPIPAPGLDNRTDLKSRVASEEINLTSKLEGSWRWSAGAMYRDDKDRTFQVNDTYPAYTSTLSDDFTDTSKSAAVYGEIGQRFLDDRLEWTLGARYFHDDEGTQANGPVPDLNVPLNRISTTSSATTPRAVLQWKPRKEMSMYASYSQGFRSGMPQDELVGARIQNFPALQPDKLTNYEAGMKGTLWDRLLSYDVAVYYIKWRNIQQQLQVPASSTENIYVIVNGGSASGEGAEFSVAAHPVDGLSIGVNFGWNNLHFNSTTYSGGDVLFAEGARPNDSPAYTAGLSADYVFPLGIGAAKGIVSLSGNYISPLNTTTIGDGAIGGNSLVLSQARAGVQFPEHWTIALFVDNANNYHGTQEPVDGVPQWDTRIRPRTYGVRFDYHLR